MMKKLQLLVSFSLLFLAGAAMAATPQRLIASDGAASDAFGNAVATTHNTMVIGAPGATVNGNASQGAAYVFVRRGGTWQEAAKLVADDGEVDEGFGSSVAISNNMIVVGAPRAWVNGQPYRGAAYVFRKRGGGWVQAAKLVSDEVLVGDEFGFSVATDGRRIIVGVPDGRGDWGPPGGLEVGSAYVFARHGNEWQQEAKLMAQSPSFIGRFGEAVAISGGFAVVGEPAVLDHDGATHVFSLTDSGWQRMARLVPGPGGHGSRTGHAVAMVGNTLAFTEPYGGTIDTYLSGATFVYTAADDGVTGDGVLVPADWTPGGYFGTAVAMSRDAIAASNDSNDVYLFERGRDGWAETAKVVLPQGERDPFDGPSLAVARNVLAAGDRLAEVDGNAGQGAVYVYDRGDL